MSLTPKTLPFFISLIILPSLVTAQQSNPKQEALDTIIDNIPLKSIAYEVPKDLHQQFQQNPFGLPAAENKRMMNLFEQAYQKQALYRDAKDAFHTYYDEAYADSVLRWMDRKKVQKVFNKQKEFYTLEGQRKRVVNKYELDQTPPTDSRKELINNLAEHTSAAGFKIDSNVTIFRSLVSAFNTLSKQRTLGATQIEGMVGNFRNRVKQKIDEQIQNELLLMYHGINGNTLTRYGEFYQSPSGKWLKKAIKKSIQRAYEQAGKRFLSSIKSI